MRILTFFGNVAAARCPLPAVPVPRRMAMAVVEATAEELELEALDRLVEQYKERGVPMSNGELKRRLKDIKYKYSHIDAARGKATTKPKKHIIWDPVDGTKVKGSPKDWDAAWKKVESMYKDYTPLCQTALAQVTKTSSEVRRQSGRGRWP